MSNAYNAASITVLEGLDPVRKRPGMYIGGTGTLGFFFQAEDVIRDRDVTGVQTCALPILTSAPPARRCVANEWRKVCGEMSIPRLARSETARRMSQAFCRETRCPRLPRNRAGVDVPRTENTG